jgi:hypothetical protein
VIQLLSALVKHPSETGLILIHLGVLDGLPDDSSPDFVADFMRWSPDCRWLLLERNILKTISRRVLTIGQFANLSGAPVRDQPATDSFRELFNQNVQNISTANPDDLCQIIIAMKSFILSDEFLSMFACKNVIAALIARVEGIVKCELELVSSMRTIATHSQESAELFAESGIVAWIIEKLLDKRQTSKYLKRLIELFGDILATFWVMFPGVAAMSAQWSRCLSAARRRSRRQSSRSLQLRSM